MSIRTSTEFLAHEPAMSAESDTFSVIDRHSRFDGTFHSDRDLRIEGEVKGTIECQGTLFVAQGATVSAKVEAENITVAGDLNGEIRCRGRLQLMPSGRVHGAVSTVTLVINEGAYYEGQLAMAPVEEGAKAPRAIGMGAEPVPLAQAAEARANGQNGSATTFIRRLGGPETAWETDEDESAAEPAPDTK